MNPGLLVKLRPAGPWRIGPDSGARNRVDSIYHSDSLYSAVSSAMARLGWLDDWLAETARAAAPAVSFSSCFPFLDEIDFVVPPRTIWPPVAPALLAARVRWKSARFVPLGIVQAMLAGRRLDEQHWSVDGPSQCLVPAGRPGPFRIDIRSNAAVDRHTGVSERHATACLEFRPGAGLWTVVSFLDDAARGRWLDPVKAAFRLLADAGFGGERSRGWGRAESPEFVEGQLPDMILPPPDRVETVTAAAPGPEAGLRPQVEPRPEAAPAPIKEPPGGEGVEIAAGEAATAAPEAAPALVEEPPAAEAAVVACAGVAPLAVETETAPAPVEEPPAAESADQEDEEFYRQLRLQREAERAKAGVPAAETPLEAEPESSAEAQAAPTPVEEPPAAESAEIAAGEAAVVASAGVAPLVVEPEVAPVPVEESPAAESAEITAGEAAVVASVGVAPLEVERDAAPAPVEEPPAAEGSEIAAGEAAVVASADVAPLVVEPEAAPVAVGTPPGEPAATVAPAPTGPVSEPPAPAAVHLHWLLSLFSPAPADAVDWTRGNYSVVTRGGRVESPAGSGEVKKLVQMVAEGSVLCGAAPTGAAPDVAPDGFAHPVFRAGFAVAIPLPGVRS